MFLTLLNVFCFLFFFVGAERGLVLKKPMTVKLIESLTAKEWWIFIKFGLTKSYGQQTGFIHDENGLRAKLRHCASLEEMIPICIEESIKWESNKRSSRAEGARKVFNYTFALSRHYGGWPGTQGCQRAPHLDGSIFEDDDRNPPWKTLKNRKRKSGS